MALDAPAGVQLFVYDNDYLIVRSDLPYEEQISLVVEGEAKGMDSINTRHFLSAAMERQSQGENGKKNGAAIAFAAAPGVNQVYKLNR